MGYMPPLGQHKYTMKHTTVLGSFLVIAAILSGCASRGYNRADSAASSVRNAATRVEVGALQIDIALTALSQLVNNPAADMKPQFSKFDSAVDDLKSLSKDIAGKSESMQKKGTAYFQKWDEELARIQNEDIRNRSATRKTEVIQGFQRVQANYQFTASQLAPFISRLTDIRTALSTDLTPAGLDAIRASANSANTEGASVTKALRDLSADFKSLGISLSPAVPQPEQPSQPQAQPQSQPTTPSVGS